jgi:hypothetical protein
VFIYARHTEAQGAAEHDGRVGVGGGCGVWVLCCTQWGGVVLCGGGGAVEQHEHGTFNKPRLALCVCVCAMGGRSSSHGLARACVLAGVGAYPVRCVTLASTAVARGLLLAVAFWCAASCPAQGPHPPAPCPQGGLTWSLRACM